MIDWPYNKWVYDETDQAIYLVKSDNHQAWGYYVDLDRCETSAEVLDWICQIAKKTWATDEIIAGLVREINRVLNPQATLCSWGVEQGPVDWSERRRLNK